MQVDGGDMVRIEAWRKPNMSDETQPDQRGIAR
jgi:hypothetical protein